MSTRVVLNLALLISGAKLLSASPESGALTALARETLNHIRHTDISASDARFAITIIANSAVAQSPSVKDMIADVQGLRGITISATPTVTAKDTRETSVIGDESTAGASETADRSDDSNKFRAKGILSSLEEQLLFLERDASVRDQRKDKLRYILRQIDTLPVVGRRVLRLRLQAISSLADIDPDEAIAELRSMAVAIDYVIRALPVIVGENEYYLSDDGKPPVELLWRTLAAEFGASSQGLSHLTNYRFSMVTDEVSRLGDERLRLVLRLMIISSTSWSPP